VNAKEERYPLFIPEMEIAIQPVALHPTDRDIPAMLKYLHINWSSCHSVTNPPFDAFCCNFKYEYILLVILRLLSCEM
jgi:hypothetical protein